MKIREMLAYLKEHDPEDEVYVFDGSEDNRGREVLTVGMHMEPMPLGGGYIHWAYILRGRLIGKNGMPVEGSFG